MMNYKEDILENLKKTLSDELEVTVRAAKAAHEAATHEELVAENKYDTKGLEASYLAGAQAKRAQELRRDLDKLHDLNLRSFHEEDAIAFGALICLEELSSGEERYLFLLPSQGGLEWARDGKRVSSVTNDAPLGKAILGKKQGDEISVEIKGKRNYYEITAVY